MDQLGKVITNLRKYNILHHHLQLLKKEAVIPSYVEY